MKIRGCSLAMWAAHDTFLFFKRSEAFIIIIISFAVVCWCRNGDCPFRVHTETETQRKVLGGERPEFSLFLSLLLSFLLLFILSISLSCRSSSSLIGAVQSADSPFMADGGRGVGLLECWHVPIRATVLHYSISARESTAVKASFISGLELS